MPKVSCFLTKIFKRIFLSTFGRWAVHNLPINQPTFLRAAAIPFCKKIVSLMMSPNNYPAEKCKSDKWKFGFSDIMYIFIFKFIYKQQIHLMKSMSSHWKPWTLQLGERGEVQVRERRVQHP